jgi:sodium-dependent phosphate transporter
MFASRPQSFSPPNLILISLPLLSPYRISASVAAGLAVIGGAIFIPLLKRKVAREAAAAQEAALNPGVQVEMGAAEVVDVEKMAAMEGEKPAAGQEGAVEKREGGHTNWDGSVSYKEGNFYQSIVVHEVPKDASLISLPMHYSKRTFTAMWRQAAKGLTYDVHSQVESSSQQVMDMHNNAEVFKPETEKMFQYLQVLSSCCVAFAHGSNDVANSIGPFSAIFTTYQTHTVPSSKTPTPKWIFAMGSSLLVIGLLTYGYNIIMTLGVQLLKLTPSRGFSAELAAGLTISLASFYGIPVSTTQIIVGCETGVALCESIRHGANWMLLLKTFLGWIWTIILAIGFSACLFSMGAFAPSINMQYQIYELNYGMYNISKGLYNSMAAANRAANVSNPSYWTDPTWAPQNGSKLAATITAQNATYTKVIGKPYTGAYLTPPMSFYYFNQALSLYRNNSQSTIGINQAMGK